MNSTNSSIAGSLTRHTLTSGGVAGLLSAQDDLLKLLSLLLTALGLAWSVWEKVSRKSEVRSQKSGVSFNLLPALVLPLALALAGCHTPGSIEIGANDDHDITGTVTVAPNTNLNIGITGTGNPDTGDWQIGIVVTFKEAPEKNVSDYLVAAGFAPTRNAAPYEFTLIGPLDSELKRQAIQYALQNGASLRGVKAGVPRSAFPVPRSDASPFTFTLADAQGPVTITLSRAATPPAPVDRFPLTEVGRAAKAAVQAEVTRMAAQDATALRGYAVTYYTCGLVGLSTGSLTHQQIMLAQQGKRVSAYLQSYITATPPAALTQACLGIAAAADKALHDAGQTGVVN